ncbi:MAG TPA: peptidoglycan-binding domain-containing protein [Anaerolineaceae bacterium]
MKSNMRPLSIRMSGNDVALLHQALFELGNIIPDDELKQARFGKGTRNVVLKIQEKFNLEVTGVLDAVTRQKIRRMKSSSKKKIYVVEGNVRKSDGAPLVGFQASAFDVDVSSENLLGEARTDARGHYRIEFAEVSFRRSGRHERGGPELIVRVVDDAETELLSSRQIKNAGRHEIRDGGSPTLSGLAENFSVVDIAANKDLSVRAFITNQVEPIVANDPAKKQAVEAEVAKLSDSTTIDALLGLDPPIKGHPLFQQAEVRKADLSSLLATSPHAVSTQLQDKFISLYAAHEGSIQDFWHQLRLEPNFKAPGVVEDLQLTLQLGLLTLNNVTLVQALQNLRQQGTLQSLQDLVKLDANGWTQLINTPVNGQPIAIPLSLPGATPQEKTTNYVNTMMANLREAFATTAVAQSISARPAIDLNLVQAVLAQNPHVSLSKPLPASLNLSGLSAHNPAKAKASLEVLRQVINMFPAFDHKALLLTEGTAPLRVRR